MILYNKLIKNFINFNKMADTMNTRSLTPKKERILRHLIPDSGPNSNEDYNKY